MRAALVGSAVVSLLASPGLAQTTGGDGWDVAVQRDARFASLSFSQGPSLTFHCGAGAPGQKVFRALLTGLPEAPGRNRVLEISRPNGAMEAQNWETASSSTAAFSRDPDRLARAARLGGRLSIRLPAESDQPARTFELPLPGDPAGLDAVLTDCGLPLTNEADAVQPEYTIPGHAIYWRERPLPRFPERAMEREVKFGRAEISCAATPDGRTRDCEIVSEDPPEMGFGREALAAARRATVDMSESSAAVQGDRFTFPIVFRIF